MPWFSAQTHLLEHTCSNTQTTSLGILANGCCLNSPFACSSQLHCHINIFTQLVIAASHKQHVALLLTSNVLHHQTHLPCCLLLHHKPSLGSVACLVCDAGVNSNAVSCACEQSPKRVVGVAELACMVSYQQCC